LTSPEHWHYRMTMDAIAAGKHIYCEKPMTYTIEQSRRVAELVGRTPKIKMQVGVQGMSDDSYETANRYIKEGALGTVVLAQIDYSRNYLDDFWVNKPDPDVRPGENLDWNAFLVPRACRRHRAQVRLPRQPGRDPRHAQHSPRLPAGIDRAAHLVDG